MPLQAARAQPAPQFQALDRTWPDAEQGCICVNGSTEVQRGEPLVIATMLRDKLVGLIEPMLPLRGRQSSRAQDSQEVIGR